MADDENNDESTPRHPSSPLVTPGIIRRGRPHLLGVVTAITIGGALGLMVACGSDSGDEDEGGADETGEPPPPPCMDCECCYGENEVLVACQCDLVGGASMQVGSLACTSTPQSLEANCDAACGVAYPGPVPELDDAIITDDVPLTLNGFPLDDYHDAVAAYLYLYVSNGEKEYTLQIRRGVNNMNFDYELDS